MAHSNPVNLPASGKYVRLYVDWTAASTRANILTGSKSGDVDGEALATSMGKIAKWYTDFKTLVFTDLSISNGTAETGKAITALSYNTETGAISVTKGTFLTTHPSTSTETDTTSTVSPAHGDTFTTVDSVTRDSYGHVTKINTKTVTLPSDNDTKNTAGSTDTSSKIFLVGATSQTTYAQTYSDDQCYVTNGAFQARVVSASGSVNANTANSQTAGGLSLYGTDPATYGIMFRSTSSRGKHGYVQSDWATYFTMNNSATRGWVFYSQANVASVSGAGNAVFNGSVTVGGNTTNTSGCRMTYNSTTESLDFVFAS